jgi:hypothetical protein
MLIVVGIFDIDIYPSNAQLVEMVLDSKYKPQVGEEKLYHWQVTYVYKVLLDTALESSWQAFLHRGHAN